MGKVKQGVIMDDNFWGWRRFRTHGPWISDRLYDMLCDLVYHKKINIPRGTVLSTLERSYAENWVEF